MGENPVLQTMRDSHFDVMGARRSYFDFYMAFGYSLSVVVSGVIAWRLIFPVPALFSLVLAACLVAALLKTRG
jgi:hypothetical protein